MVKVTSVVRALIDAADGWIKALHNKPEQYELNTENTSTPIILAEKLWTYQQQ
jgi:hypothetical protein